MSITFVTAFFDIGRKTDDPSNKFENYFERINALLKIPINLYFFTTQDMHDKLVYEPRPNLKFMIVEAIPYFDRLPQVEQIWKTYITDNPTKDTPQFVCFTHAKFQFVKRAIEANPFDSTHYAWIDAGLFKVATHGERLPQLTTPNKIKLMVLHYIGKNEVLDPNFILTCRYKIAGGLWIGPKDLMLRFIDLMIEVVETDLAQNRLGLEQEYMAIIYRRHPDLFDPYYGTFADLILNYERCERSHHLANNVLFAAAQNSDPDELIRVARYLDKKPQ
jgi:hypothetical protein